MTNIHFSSKRDDWATPPDLFATLDTEFHFTLDAAASPTNTKVASFYSTADDGLAQPWNGTVWVNPPYGKGIIDRWVNKAIQSAAQGATVVMLVPARPGSRWFTQLIHHADEIRFLNRRVTFVGAADPAPFPSAIAVLRPPTHWASGDPTVTYATPQPNATHLWTTMKTTS